jgi:lysyl-tRNA synthetase class 2
MPSSAIADIEYEPELARLTVTFTSGRMYQYFMVPADLAASLQSAFSKGTFFNMLIRDRFAYQELEPSRPLNEPRHQSQ